MKPVNYDSLYDELLREYLGSEYYSAIKKKVEYIATPVTASTIDEYIMLLRKGYINVEIREEVNKHLMELFEDDWFHQWPLVRWTYASRILSEEKTEEKVAWALTTLEALAKEGWPNAICDIGTRYWIGKYYEEKHELAVCLWLAASKKGYRGVWYQLLAEFRSRRYEKLGEELQMFFLEEMLNRYLELNAVTLENYQERLDKHDTDEVKKMVSKKNKLNKSVSKRAFMRSSVAGLAWDKGEGPYKIDF